MSSCDVRTMTPQADRCQLGLSQRNGFLCVSFMSNTLCVHVVELPPPLNLETLIAIPLSKDYLSNKDTFISPKNSFCIRV